MTVIERRQLVHRLPRSRRDVVHGRTQKGSRAARCVDVIADACWAIREAEAAGHRTLGPHRLLVDVRGRTLRDEPFGEHEWTRHSKDSEKTERYLLTKVR
jgi:hypothetical protein